MSGIGSVTQRRRRYQRQSSLERPITGDASSTDKGFNHLMSYGNKKYLGKTKRSEEKRTLGDRILLSLLCLGLVVCLILLYFCYFHFHTFHFYLTHAYAHLGHAHAQHVVGERLLHGKGVPKDEEKAMEWFRKAADAGHPHAAYNLAIGHLKGMTTDVQPGEAHDLIRHAHKNGVEEAGDVLFNACGNGQCDD